MPKQGGIQESMNRFLAQYLPMLFQQRQREGYVDYSQQAYLKRFMQQLEESEKYDISTSDRARVSNLIREIFRSLQGETEGLPYASEQFIKRAKPTAETYGLQLPPEAEGLDTRTSRMAEIGSALARAKVTNTVPSDEMLREAFTLFSEEAVREEVGKFNDAALKRIDQLARDKEIDIKRTTAETGKLTALTSAGAAARAPAEAQQKQWLAFVTDIEDFLRGEGVKGGELSDRLKGLFSSGKLVDPLSSENRGAAFTYLGQIRAKLIQGETLSSGDIRFLTTVRNTAEIERPPEEGGGLVSPAVSDAEAETMEATIRAYMDFAKEETGITDEVELRRLAMEFLRIIK